MKTLRIALVAVAATVALAAFTPQGTPEIGQAAPTFTLPDTHGQSHALEQYRGQWVVLEWLNYGCPYVSKHYRTDNIPAQQRKWTDEGVVWLSIVSSAPGAQGYYEAAQMNEVSAEHGNAATAVLMDPEGTVGHLYAARTTPHMFVIDPEGELVYMGGIDDVPTARDEDLERATQLVDQALAQAMAGEPVSQPVSQPYGCNVKYK
ncbi:MAG: redoxin domain-containing protein [Gemmatimonadota bacterium]|jgi:peroxiredoxin